MAPIADHTVNLKHTLFNTRTESSLTPRDITQTSSIPTIFLFSLISVAIFAISIYLLYRIWNRILSSSKLHIFFRSKLFHRSPLSSTTTNNESDISGSKTAAVSDIQQADGGGGTGNDWARKDSNVLWSLYIDEEDLKTQFNQSMFRSSRLFSIGSISDHCPLDTQERKKSIEMEKEREKEDNKIATPSVDDDGSNKIPMHDKDEDDNGLRNRPTFNYQTTPTKPISQSPISTSFSSRRKSAGPGSITSMALTSKQHHRYSKSFGNTSSIPVMTTTMKMTPPAMLEWRLGKS